MYGSKKLQIQMVRESSLYTIAPSVSLPQGYKLKATNMAVSWLVVWVLWHINVSRLFNAKSIFMQIVSFISNNSVLHECTV